MRVKQTNCPFIILVSLSVFLILQACPFYGYKYNEGWLPEDPVPIAEFNSEYNDLNATSPVLGDHFPLAFSSDRQSEGADYNIISKLFEITFDRDDASLYAGSAPQYSYQNSQAYAVVQYALPVINSSANEFGPYIRSFAEIYGDYSDFNNERYLILFSSDRNGNQDIFLSYDSRFSSDSLNEFTIPQPILANVDFNESYPCFNQDYSCMYYCSDAEGDYDIFSVPLPAGEDMLNSLTNLPETSTLMAELNSDKDDVCPYICKNVIVFCSKREGGYGEFDLYYSEYNGTGWSAPANLGTRVNSAHNEYRPVIHYLPEFKHDLLIFSSDRPGGQGGFDLYYAGIPRRIIADQ